MLENKTGRSVLHAPGLGTKFAGALIGSAIGDAVGELAFSHQEQDLLLNKISGLPELTYTDDTAMAIGLAESLIIKGGVDRQHLGKTFHQNFLREPWRGYAPGPPAIFSMVDKTGVIYWQAARTLFGGEGSLGNGAAMRIAPVGLFYHRADDLYEKACASAEVTHAHPVGMDGAAVQAFAVAQAVKLDPAGVFPRDAYVKALVDFARTPEIKEKMKRVKALLDRDAAPDEAADRLGRSVAVQKSMPFAVFSFLRHAESFEEALFCAIFHGGDRDTLGAMTGAISGAYLGESAIPSSWKERLENRSRIEALARELARRLES